MLRQIGRSCSFPIDLAHPRHGRVATFRQGISGQQIDRLRSAFRQATEVRSQHFVDQSNSGTQERPRAISLLHHPRFNGAVVRRGGEGHEGERLRRINHLYGATGILAAPRRRDP